MTLTNLVAILLTSCVLIGAARGDAPAARPQAPASGPARDYHFDGAISREVLENYLSRSVTMEGLLNGRGDLDDNVRMLKRTGAKFIGRALCLWGGEADLPRNLERAKRLAPTVHAADPEMVLQACVFEIVSTQVETTAPAGCGTPGTGCAGPTPTVTSKCPAAARSARRATTCAGTTPTPPAPQPLPASATRTPSRRSGRRTGRPNEQVSGCLRTLAV